MPIPPSWPRWLKKREQIREASQKREESHHTGEEDSHKTKEDRQRKKRDRLRKRRREEIDEDEKMRELSEELAEHRSEEIKKELVESKEEEEEEKEEVAKDEYPEPEESSLSRDEPNFNPVGEPKARHKSSVDINDGESFIRQTVVAGKGKWSSTDVRHARMKDLNEPEHRDVKPSSLPEMQRYLIMGAMICLASYALATNDFEPPKTKTVVVKKKTLLERHGTLGIVSVPVSIAIVSIAGYLFCQYELEVIENQRQRQLMWNWTKVGIIVVLVGLVLWGNRHAVAPAQVKQPRVLISWRIFVYCLLGIVAMGLAKLTNIVTRPKSSFRQ